MGIINRFKDIMDANINSVLSNAEEKNADKLLEKYLRDAKNNLSNVKSETAAVIAEEKAAERKLSECKANIEKYNNYAVSAVKAGNDSDARKFLEAKHECASKLENLEKAYELAAANSEKMRRMTDKLVDEISKTEAKMTELRSQLAIAKQREKQAAFNEKLSSGMGSQNIDSLFDSVQKRIDKAEALSEMNSADSGNALEDLEKKYDGSASDIESELDSLKSGAASVDDELEKLKRDLGV